VQRRVLVLAGALVVFSQARYARERVAFLSEIGTYAAADADERERRAFLPASREIVEWVRKETRPGAAILFVTAERRPEGSPDDVLYHRLLVELYPRRVFWVTPAAERVYPAWWKETDLSERSLSDLARELGATELLAHGLSAPLPGRTRSLDAVTHLTALARPR
jgi:hypothetical protein